jgi:hypothetical protein
MTASRGVLFVALALLAVAALRDVARLGDALPWHQLYDFADFYCAGAALDQGADPYRYEPLHRCEHAVSTNPVFRSDPQRVVPAPLPPYDFPPFMLAARLSFMQARALDAAAIVVAVLLAMWGLSLVAVPFDVAALALVLPAGYVLLNAGQVVPFALLALVFCGVALARGRPRLAGMLAALTAIEPHLGLPVCLAVLLYVPRGRVGLLAVAVALVSIGVLLVGAAGFVEFLTRVLPAQAASEAGYVYQYSLAYLLRTSGVPAPPALFAGELSYVVMLAAGIALGRRVALSVARPELLAYIPAACSIVAGPYVHMVDLAFAIPAALVLTVSLRGNARVLAIVALSLLTVPWIHVWITKKLFLATLAVIGALLLRLRAPALTGAAVFVGIAAAIYLLELVPPPPLTAATIGIFSPVDLAQRAWTAYVEQLNAGSVVWLVVKLPTWLGLAALLAACLAALRVGRPAPVET